MVSYERSAIMQIGIRQMNNCSFWLPSKYFSGFSFSALNYHVPQNILFWFILVGTFLASWIFTCVFQQIWAAFNCCFLDYSFSSTHSSFLLRVQWCEHGLFCNLPTGPENCCRFSAVQWVKSVVCPHIHWLCLLHSSFQSIIRVLNFLL
jgi:hypothetical protein